MWAATYSGWVLQDLILEIFRDLPHSIGIESGQPAAILGLGVLRGDDRASVAYIPSLSLMLLED